MLVLIVIGDSFTMHHSIDTRKGSIWERFSVVSTVARTLVTGVGLTDTDVQDSLKIIQITNCFHAKLADRASKLRNGLQFINAQLVVRLKLRKILNGIISTKIV